MDSRVLFGLGVSIVFAFLRWRLPVIPKPLATAGVVVGVGLLVWSAFPDFNIRWVAVFIAIVAVVTALLDALCAPAAKPAVVPVAPNTVDQRVISHFQSGGITARNVGDENVDR